VLGLKLNRVTLAPDTSGLPPGASLLPQHQRKSCDVDGKDFCWETAGALPFPKVCGLQCVHRVHVRIMGGVLIISEVSYCPHAHLHCLHCVCIGTTLVHKLGSGSDARLQAVVLLAAQHLESLSHIVLLLHAQCAPTTTTTPTPCPHPHVAPTLPLLTPHTPSFRPPPPPRPRRWLRRLRPSCRNPQAALVLPYPSGLFTHTTRT
jgi:hypothetical protein